MIPASPQAYPNSFGSNPVSMTGTNQNNYDDSSSNGSSSSQDDFKMDLGQKKKELRQSNYGEAAQEMMTKPTPPPVANTYTPTSNFSSKPLSTHSTPSYQQQRFDKAPPAAPVEIAP